MMKFFRKYNKQMLAVLMALLLIVWLAGDALQYFLDPNRANRVVATSKFGDITSEEWTIAQQHVHWIERLGLSWQYPLGRAQVIPLDLPAWVMLRKEARQMGIESSRPVVQNILTQMRVTDNVVLRLAQQANVKTDIIYDAAASFADVVRYLGKVSQSASVNEAELRQLAQASLHKVQVNAVVLPGEAFLDPDATFADSEVQEQFDKYKDKKRSGSGLNFGYMLPPRLKVQYVKIEPTKLEEKIVETEKLVEEARRYWGRNKESDLFKRPEEPPASQPATETSEPETQPADAPAEPASQPVEADAEPATQPANATLRSIGFRPRKTDKGFEVPSLAPGSPAGLAGLREGDTLLAVNGKGSSEFDDPAEWDQLLEAEKVQVRYARGPAEPREVEIPVGKYFSKWADAKDIALKEVRKKIAADDAKKAAEGFTNYALEPWMHAENGPDQFKVAPEAAKSLDHFETLLKSPPAGLRGLDTATVATSDWLSPETVTDLPGLGTAAVENAGLPFSDLAFAVQGLATIPTGEDAEAVDRSVFIARYQPSRYPLKDGEGNWYVFRVIDVDAERPPRDLAEVRDQVVTDVRKAKGYAEAEQAAQKLQEQVGTNGLAAAWESQTELKAKVEQFSETEKGEKHESGFRERVQFSRRSSFGTSEFTRFVPQIGEVTEAFLDGCLALGKEEGSGPRVKSIAMPESGTVVVVEWVKDIPADQNTFTMMKSFISSQLQQTRQESYLASWITPQQVRARTGFEFKSAG